MFFWWGFLQKIPVIEQQYGIKSNQIYNLTTDNSANLLKCVLLFSEKNVTERTANVEHPSCSSWQSDAELVSDEDDSGTVNRIKLKFSSATSVLRIPAQLKQEISGKVYDVLLTLYSWQ